MSTDDDSGGESGAREPVRVAFRKEPGGDVVAVFLDQREGSQTLCYTLVRGHRPMRTAALYRRTTVASPAEYGPLAEHLRTLGYTLNIEHEEGRTGQ